MTSTLAPGVGRSPGEPVRPLRALAVSPALIVLLLGGLALRLTIAYVLFPSSGFETDISSYASWALTLGEFGPGGFYANAGFADYPPAYLYLLWPIGLLGGEGGIAPASELVKLPAILLDLAVGYVIYRLVRGWTWPSDRSERLALVAAALYLFNPVSIYDSALWGQTDAAGALVLLLGVAALIRGNSEGAAAFAVMAALVKPQFGVVLIPIVAAVLIKRHLVRPGSGPRHRPWAVQPLRDWLSKTQRWPRLLTSFVAVCAVFFVVALPFGMGPVEYLERMFGTAGGYSSLSVNAYNLWALVGSDGTPSLAEALAWSDDTVGLVGPIPGVVIGAVLLAAGFLWGTLRAAIRDDRWTILVAITFLAIAFFILPTRVHERYIFPAVALLPLLAVMNLRWSLALVLLSAGAFINLHGILTLTVYSSPNVSSLPLGELFRDQPFVVASALLQTGVGLFAAWQLRPSVRTSPDAYELESARGRPGPQAVVDDASADSDWVPPPGALAYAVDAVRNSSTGLDGFIARVSKVPLRRDRSADLAREPGGRIDRVDLLAVILLVIFALTLRGFRLDQPAGMYFDEVYHARTATEFLQDWEYDIPHDIYEFTHPHLAKYAMAWGIRVAGGNEVTGTSELGAPAIDAVLEHRWSGENGNARSGDRLYVATGDTVTVVDLVTRDVTAQVPVAAVALAVDEDLHRLFVADPKGSISVLDTLELDEMRGGGETDVRLEPFSIGPGAPVGELVVTDDSLVTTTAGSIATWDLESGAPLSERFAFDTAAAVELPWAPRLLVDTALLPDRAAAADSVADILDEDPARLVDLLEDDAVVVVAAYLDDDSTAALEEAIDDGVLAGARVESGPLLATAGPAGITIMDAVTLDEVESFSTDEPATALTLVERGLSDPTLYATAGASLETIRLEDEQPFLARTVEMPGVVRELAWNEPASLVHALGEAPDGGPTVYVVEPNGNAVFIDVPLTNQPHVLLADTQPDRPDEDRRELLAIAADGSVSTVGIGQNAFGWRIPGVLLAALAAALLYLLARVLFARRSIAVLAGLLVVAEGMLFANSRIAMNDVYVTTFIVLAVLLMAPLYLAPRRPWTALAIIVLAGMALGLALASKWVALYAIGGVALLVLLRSAIGRAMALMAMIAMTAVLGAMTIRAPPAGTGDNPLLGAMREIFPAAPVEDPTQNWAFLALMMLLTASLAAAMVRRPLSWGRVEVGYAVLGPVAAGLALALLGRPLIGGALMALGAVALIAAFVVTARGRGPFVIEPLPDPSTSGWLRPGWLLGLPWLLTLGALTMLPVGIYILTYAPWVELGNQWGLPLLGSLPLLPASAEGGKTVADLTESMYQYHDNLRASHAASSPWWAWPLDLKPVWFFQQRYEGPTTGLIFDTGNLVVFWLGIPAMAFAAWIGWRRRSAALALVVIMFAAMWLPWARIDRATFQYHYYAALPFVVLALAYFLGELWHGPSARVWFLARVAGVLAFLAAPVLWLLRTPLCILAGTTTEHPDGVACASEVSRPIQLTESVAVALFVIGAGAAFAGFLAWRASRASARHPEDTRAQAVWLGAIVVVALATLTFVIGAFVFLDSGSPLALRPSSDVLALMGLALMAIPAWLTFRARDAHRFVIGAIAIAMLWMLVWYPNISGLPLPSNLAAAYQGLLPTWNWDFQFAVNGDPASDAPLIGAGTALIGVATVALVAAVAFAAGRWGRDRESGSDEQSVSIEAPPGR